MTFSAKNLPASLKLDRQTGIISGTTPERPGEFLVTIKASNSLGSDTRPLKIMVGDTLGLTPQMGWNDWYSYYEHISDRDIRTAANAMISSGLADYGYQYVDIDDCWARKPGSDDPDLKGPTRDAQGNILPNSRFPDMAALTAYIHSLGLKTGIYSSPGPLTCAKFEGSYGHEEADAHRVAAWGFDLFKYDWCSYEPIAKDKSLAEVEKPYTKMGGILRGLDHDVVLNMCQYGNGRCLELGTRGRQQRLADYRRPRDGSCSDALPGFLPCRLRQCRARRRMPVPADGDDPDYILIGTSRRRPQHRTYRAGLTCMTHEEQYSYMSMWSLMAAPLIFSGEMTHLDPFTLNVLSNSEVIDVDQDSLGKQASVVRKTDDEFILEKPLEDGSVAVGFFNLTPAPHSISADWKQLGLNGTQTVRDVWRQHDLGSFADSFSAQVPPHGVILVRLTPMHVH